MLYFGVKLYVKSFVTTALSEGFACLDTKYFDETQIDSFYQWVDSFKNKEFEKCYWFFDEYSFHKYTDIASNFYYDLYNATLENQSIQRKGAAVDFDVFDES